MFGIHLQIAHVRRAIACMVIVCGMLLASACAQYDSDSYEYDIIVRNETQAEIEIKKDNLDLPDTLFFDPTIDPGESAHLRWHNSRFFSDYIESKYDNRSCQIGVNEGTWVVTVDNQWLEDNCPS